MLTKKYTHLQRETIIGSKVLIDSFNTKKNGESKHPPAEITVKIVYLCFAIIT